MRAEPDPERPVSRVSGVAVRLLITPVTLHIELSGLAADNGRKAP